HTRSKRDWSSDVCSSDLSLGISVSVNSYLDIGLDQILQLLKLSQTAPFRGIAKLAKRQYLNASMPVIFLSLLSISKLLSARQRSVNTTFEIKQPRTA